MRPEEPMPEPTNASSVLEAVLRFNAGRNEALVARKLEAIAGGPFAFFRGAAHLFYDGWSDAAVRAAGVAEVPLTWAVGDLHLENFGSYRGDNRLTYFDVNDFDEAELAPATVDLTRLLTSVLLATAAPDGDTTLGRGLCVCLLASYRAALAIGTARWLERRVARGPVRTLLRQVRTRSRGDLLAEWTERGQGRRRIRVRPGHTRPATADECDAVRETLAAFARRVPNDDVLSATDLEELLPDAERRTLSAGLPGRLAARVGRPRAFGEVIDVAHRVAGTGSLGLPRYVVLVRDRAAPSRHALLDLKAARASILRDAGVSRPHREAWPTDAARVVVIQRRVQAVPPAHLAAVDMGATSFVLRELQPSADRVRLADLAGRSRQLATLMHSVGQVVAWAQLRSGGSGGAGTADAWREWARSLDRTAVRALLDDAHARYDATRRQWRAFVSVLRARSAAGAGGVR
jgi:uncharacterized protein (DUF2252 family)